MSELKRKLLIEHGYSLDDDGYKKRDDQGNYVKIARQEKQDKDLDWLKKKIANHRQILG